MSKPFFLDIGKFRLAMTCFFFKDFSLNVNKLHQIINLILHRFYNLSVVSVNIFDYGT